MAGKRAGDLLNAREYQELADRAALPTNGGVADGPGGVAIPRPALLRGLSHEAANSCIGLNPTGGTDLKSYAPCEIVDGIYTGAYGEYKNALKIGISTANAVGKFAICAEAIPAGFAGRIYTSGVALVRLKTNSGDKFADIKTAGDDFLTGDPSVGSAQILWEDGGHSTSVHYARVRFPLAGGAEIGSAVCASNVSLTLSGNQTIDGVTTTNGVFVLALGQSTPSQNGVYSASSGGWIKQNTPKLVIVTGGSLFGGLGFYSVGTTWTALGGALVP